MPAKKKIEEEIKLEKEPEFVEIQIKNEFHTVCTRLGNVQFVEGKAVVTKEMYEELKKLEIVK